MLKSPLITRLGTSVRTLRHSLGISQETLAERADLHRTYIADIERGARNITLRSVEKLAGALEVSAASLRWTPAGRPCGWSGTAGVPPVAPARTFCWLSRQTDHL